MRRGRYMCRGAVLGATLFLGQSIVGCSTNEQVSTSASTATEVSPEKPPSTPSAPSAPEAVPGWPGAHPPGAPVPSADAPACEVELFTSVEEHPDGHWDVIARARNRTPRALNLTLPKVCTGAPAEFAGIPRYDYYARCTMGACVEEPRGRTTVNIEPRGMAELARGRVDPKGNSCNAPVPPGRYPALVAVDLQGAVVCLGPSDVLDLNPGGVPAPARPPQPGLRTTLERKSPPPPPPAKCKPGPVCGVGCPGGRYKHDENGCTLCACEELFIPGLDRPTQPIPPPG